MDFWKNKNLVFYTSYPDDTWSQEFLSKLKEIPKLYDQCIKICINDSKIKLPPSIAKYKISPIFIPCGIDTPLLGKDAIDYLYTNGFQNKPLGFESIDSAGSGTLTFLQDDNLSGQINRNGPGKVNPEYNQGYTGRDGVLTSYTKFYDINRRIETFEEKTEKGSSVELQRRYEKMTEEHRRDTPKSSPIVQGGFDIPQVTRGSQAIYNNGIRSRQDAVAPVPVYNSKSFQPPQFVQTSQQSRLPPINSVLGAMQVPRSFNPSL